MENLKLESLKSYEDLVAEAKRTIQLPRWVHVGALATYAKDVFGVTHTQFTEDIQLERSPSCVSNWANAYSIWRRLPQSERKKSNYVVDYKMAYGLHAKKRMDAKTAFATALKHHHRETMRIYLSSLRSLTLYAEQGDLRIELAKDALKLARRLVRALNGSARQVAA